MLEFLMSEQQEKISGGAIGGSMVMEEKTPGNRHKQPYRPTELQDDTDNHHKRRKHAVPTVDEELKHYTEDSASIENKDFKELEEFAAVAISDKHKQSSAKNILSSTERRDHSPESIILTSIEVNKKPIPYVQSARSDLVAAEKEVEKKADEDSITEEVEELQTSEVVKKHSEWSDDDEAGGLPRSDSRSSRVTRMVTNQCLVKKKEISWNKDEGNAMFEAVKKSETLILDRKASVGPCIRYKTPSDGSSGITICLPKKSLKCVNQSSGININISRKCLTKSKSNVIEMDSHELKNLYSDKNKSDKITCDVKFANILDNFKGKINNVQSKIKSFFC